MPMCDDWRAAILINDLDSMVLRIEALSAHPQYTTALCAVQQAKAALITGRSEIHAREMRARLSPEGVRS
ncbi:MAG: hypothetical protein DI606_04355 [Sphingobium sp.]|uniref:hypothetical protein n=1 Tax=Sphingobium sp. TaxID=1912891 RepID=UPI000DB62461|nr:hypothetical protein [Sphingobium sp.]PZU13803.1 MAG: hypothetical protein DI606_04355 [Sphingobium sp.]